MPKNPPENMPRITPYLLYEDVGAALEWLGKAFGFSERMRLPGPDGKINHAEMELADGLVMMLRRAVKNANGGPIWLDKSTTGLTTNTEKRWRTAERMELAKLEEHGKRIKVTLTTQGEAVLADQEPAK